MASKRLWQRVNRTGSFSYWEIVLEALVVLVVITELSVECGKASFPTWRQSRVEPTSRMLQYTELVSGIPLDSLLNPCQPIDGRAQINNTESRMGSVLLLCATAVLYVSFAAFVLANRNWKPSVIPLTDNPAAEKYEILSLAVLITFYLYSGCIIHSVDVMGWWKYPVESPLTKIIGWIWLVVIGCRPRGISKQKPASSDTAKPSQKKEPASPDAAKPSPVKEPATREATEPSQKIDKFISAGTGIATNNCFLSCAFVFVGALLVVLGVAVVVVVVVVGFAALVVLAVAGLVLVGAVLSLFLLMSTFSAILLIRGTVAVFGEAAAFPALVVVSCLLVMHCTGRMFGIWLAESNVVWIAKKFKSMRKSVDITEDSSCAIVSVKVDSDCSATQCSAKVNKGDPSTSGTKIVLDFMVVSVISSTLWFLYVSGTTHNRDDASPWHILTSGKLPQCFTTLMTEFFSASTNSTRSCWFLDHPFSPVENRLMDASFAISGLITFLMVPPWFPVTALMIMGFVVFLLASCISYCCPGVSDSEPPSPKKVAETVPRNGLYELHCVMAVFPLYFVKVILPWYALDFLPGDWYIPGITVYLVGYAGYFFWTLPKRLVAWLESGSKEDRVAHPCKEKSELNGKQSGAQTVEEVAHKNANPCDTGIDVKATALLLQA